MHGFGECSKAVAPLGLRDAAKIAVERDGDMLVAADAVLDGLQPCDGRVNFYPRFNPQDSAARKCSCFTAKRLWVLLLDGAIGHAAACDRKPIQGAEGVEWDRADISYVQSNAAKQKLLIRHRQRFFSDFEFLQEMRPGFKMPPPHFASVPPLSAMPRHKREAS